MEQVILENGNEFFSWDRTVVEYLYDIEPSTHRGLL